ncbi:hypothetical protein Forpi1262_v014938 [Fusarium oxysporum f. sp. raphani]|uniref:Uncharacterized protein n=1 Tax=Fusarium oxysporum f. sp. raphani TaxID=96318 RepID=A0A8J5U7V1_FUSOX|nr:hypothetical protein Forpi1262_v014938 [Fusarium oxysporum f. sp. raphani]
MLPFLIYRILIRYLIISPVHFDSPLLHHTFRNTRLPKLAFIPSNFTSLVAANVSGPALIQPFFHNRASSFLLKKEVWRLKGQGGPYRPVSPDMFESNDYLRFDLEHPRQAAFVRVSVEDNLAKTGTAFKFACVEFRDSTSAKKYVANIKLKRS